MPIYRELEHLRILVSTGSRSQSPADAEGQMSFGEPKLPMIFNCMAAGTPKPPHGSRVNCVYTHVVYMYATFIWHQRITALFWTLAVKCVPHKFPPVVQSITTLPRTWDLQACVNKGCHGPAGHLPGARGSPHCVLMGSGEGDLSQTPMDLRRRNWASGGGVRSPGVSHQRTSWHAWDSNAKEFP